MNRKTQVIKRKSLLIYYERISYSFLLLIIFYRNINNNNNHNQDNCILDKISNKVKFFQLIIKLSSIFFTKINIKIR